ncbi:MAG: hypothetical protein ACI39R_07015 [Lachnospiraceae bacterium]
MKNTLNVLMKKDIKILLPGIVMFLMAAVALCVMCVFGIFTGNGNFTVTAIYVFFFAMIIVCVYNVFKGANLYRKNLSDADYLKSVADRNITSKQFILGKMLWTWTVTAVSLTVYLAGFVSMVFVASNMLPETTDEMEKQEFTSFIPETFADMDFLKGVLSYIVLLAVVAGITAMVYMAFELCFMYFIRGRYAVIASIMTIFCIFWIIWKVFDFIVPVSGMGAMLGTIIYALVIGAICIIIHLLTAAKKIFTFDE